VLGSNLSITWEYGAFVGLGGAFIAVVGGVIRRGDPEVILPGLASPPRSPVSYAVSGPPPGSGPGAAVCKACGAAMPAGNPFCHKCGTPVT
jgi:hypothetical protein